MPARCNKEWFQNTFLGGAVCERSNTASIFDLIENLMMYDPLTVLAAVPSFRDAYFSLEAKQVKGTTHTVAGVTKERSGIVASKNDCLVQALHELLVDGVTHPFTVQEN